MTMIHVGDVEFLEEVTTLGDLSLERRDSLKHSPYTDGTLDHLSQLAEFRDLIKERGTVCREDALRLSEFSTESSILDAHTHRYPPFMYTESLSKTLYDQTLVSLESSVLKSVGDTLTTVTRFIGDHGRSAVQYIKEVFDEDARTNENIRRSAHLIDYLEASMALLGNTSNASKFKRDLSHVEKIVYDKYTAKWNGLKDAISLPEKETATLAEAISLPVIDLYPTTMETIKAFIEDVAKSKSQADIEKIVKGYKTPATDMRKLSRWVDKHVPRNEVTDPHGTVTQLQSLGMTVRTHVKSLENNRTVRVSFKPDAVLKTIADTQWTTTQAIADDIMKKVDAVLESQDTLVTELNRLAKDTLVDTEMSHVVLHVVLELLSIVRGFGALIDAIGVITVVKRNLVQEQLVALGEGVKAIHEITKNKKKDLTVGEVTELNELTTTLKQNLSH